MRRIAIIGAMLVTSLWPVGSAFAQQFPGVGPGSFTQTADATSFVPTPATPDGQGNILEGAAADGNLSGSPLSGTFHVQETRAHSVDGLTGTVQGQFTFRDGAGNTLYGTTSGQFLVGPTSSSADGEFTISGGSGAYAGAMGSGSFTEVMAMPDGTPTLTFAGSWSGQPGSPAASQLTGASFPTSYTVGPTLNGQPPVVFVPVPNSVFNQINQGHDNDNDDHGNGNDRNDRWAQNNGHDNGRHRGQHKDD